MRKSVRDKTLFLGLRLGYSHSHTADADPKMEFYFKEAMMKNNLLIEEPPLQVLPSLANLIGLNEAIILQQVHYWLNNKNSGVERNGYKWVYNSYKDWKNNFPFWSERTIQRAITNLENMGILISTQNSSYNRKKYYRIDYDKMSSSMTTKWHDGTCQNGTFDDDKMACSSLTENTTKTTTENIEADKSAKQEPIYEDCTEVIEPVKKKSRSNGYYKIASAMAQVTGTSLESNKEQIYREAKLISRDARVTPEEIIKQFAPGGDWYRYDWRGQKGQRPTISQIRQTIFTFSEPVTGRRAVKNTGMDAVKAELARLEQEDVSR